MFCIYGIKGHPSVTESYPWHQNKVLIYTTQCMNLLNLTLKPMVGFLHPRYCALCLLYLHGCCYHFTLQIYRQLKFGTFCCIHNQIYRIHLWTWNLSVAETVANRHFVTSPIVSVVASDLILRQPCTNHLHGHLKLRWLNSLLNSPIYRQFWLFYRFRMWSKGVKSPGNKAIFGGFLDGTTAPYLV